MTDWRRWRSSRNEQGLVKTVRQLLQAVDDLLQGFCVREISREALTLQASLQVCDVQSLYRDGGISVELA
jgi:hypothetical protein